MRTHIKAGRRSTEVRNALARIRTLTTMQTRSARQLAYCVLVSVTVIACTDAAPPAPTTTTTSPPPPIQWTQTWSDEFDGPAGAAIDPTKWVNEVGDGCAQRLCGWGNNEKESYSADTGNVSMNGQGQLVIVGKVSPSGLTCYYGACRYTSARITTRGRLVASATGKVEARIKLPSGQGLWPAFWMLGSTCPEEPWPSCGEIDIMENKGSQPFTTSSALHGPGYSGQTPFAHSQTFQSSTVSDFHTYAVEWDTSNVRWLVDGREHYQVTRGDIERYGTSVLGKSFIVILNLAIGGHFDGDPQTDSIFPAVMLVDYVRVFTPKSP